jgi:ABC-type phosphate/phosphonate transport system substrate-binding protein
LIASLGMYDRPETAAANDRLWNGIRGHLLARGLPAPDRLTRGEGAYWAAWQSPDLILSQTCGLPFRARLHDKVTLVGTPDYGVEGCAPGYYRSVFVARAADAGKPIDRLAAGVFAFNDRLSQSGWAAAQPLFAATGRPPRALLETGGHRASAHAVLDAQADLAAIDAVTWALLRRHEPALQGLAVVGTSAPTPGLPLIAAKGQDGAAILAAVDQAIRELSAADRQTLMLQGVVHIPVADYLALPIPAAPDRVISLA